MSVLETSVLIIGAGPVGLALALDLGQRGIDCVVIEQGDGLNLLPRASGVAARTMEHCRRWGIAGEIFFAGFPRDYRLDTIYCTSVTGYELERQPSPAMQDLPPLAFSPENKARCPQHLFDPLLERAALREQSVAIHRRCRLVGFTETGDGVLAQVERLADSAVYDFDRARFTIDTASDGTPPPGGFSVRARYMVACDGVSSPVREALGIGVEGAGPDGSPLLSYSVSALVSIPGLTRFHDKGDAERFLFLGDEGVWGNLTVVDGRGRWRLTIAGNEAKMDLAALDMPALIRRALGRDDIPFEIEVITPWRRRQLVANQLRKGRVFLAGDAIHAMSPTGGFGMNTGVGDSVDLGWKLEAVLHGWADEALLDSYEAERGPIGRRNVSAATANFKPWSMALDYSRINEPSPAGAQDRRVIGKTIKEALLSEWESWGVTMGYRYEDSPVIVPDGTPAPPEDFINYTQSARPGARAPHGWLGDGRSTLDLFGRGFVLLQFGGDATETGELAATAERIGFPLRIVPIDQPEIAALYERRFVLVRPDGHVAWRGDTLPQNTTAMLNTVRGNHQQTQTPLREKATAA